MTEKSLEKYFDKLWPINRSIMGPGYRDSLKILDEIMDTKKIFFKTGEKVLDWTVPEEWVAKEAYIIDPNGRKILDLAKNNLHLVSHSIPVNKELSLNELKKHLFTLPSQNDAIPYITSYYKKDWGFCIKYSDYEQLPEGKYKVFIDSKLSTGNLVIGESTIGNNNNNFICFSSYLCHPSMANNELSGPLVLSHLYKKIKKKKLNHTYKFYVLPETIGSISLLSRKGDDFKKKLIAGYHLTCIGDGGILSFKHSRKGNSLADLFANKLMEDIPHKTYGFNPAFGSDERQFCSPGFDLPYCSFSRSIYTEYPEYHTSLDNKALMDFAMMSKTVNHLYKLIKLFEKIKPQFFKRYLNLYNQGEPQLGKRGLFRHFSTKQRDQSEIAMWWVLNFSDGSHTILDIANKSKLKPELIYETSKILEKEKILFSYV